LPRQVGHVSSPIPRQVLQVRCTSFVFMASIQ
jgi:hypothetical protein